MADKKIIPASRGNRLRRLGGKNGQEYAVVRNGQIQAGQEARDYLKEFSVYIGSDGKSSRSAVDKETGDHRESGGNVHVAANLEGFGGVIDKDHELRLWRALSRMLKNGAQAIDFFVGDSKPALAAADSQ